MPGRDAAGRVSCLRASYASRQIDHDRPCPFVSKESPPRKLESRTPYWRHRRDSHPLPSIEPARPALVRPGEALALKPI